MNKIIAALCFLISLQALAIENVEISLSQSADSKRLFEQLSLPNIPSIDENSNSVLTRTFATSDSAAVLACKKIISGVLVSHTCAVSIRLESEENTSTLTQIAPAGAVVAELNENDSDKIFSALVGIKRFSSLEKISIKFNNKDLMVPRLTIDCPNAITNSGVVRTGLCQIVAFK